MSAKQIYAHPLGAQHGRTDPVGALASETPSSGRGAIGSTVGASQGSERGVGVSPDSSGGAIPPGVAPAAPLPAMVQSLRSSQPSEWDLWSRVEALETEIAGLRSVVEMAVTVVTTAVDKGCICSLCCATLDAIAERGTA